MCVQPKNEVRSCNNCRSGKAPIITYYECVFVALGVQYAMRMRHIEICGLPGSKLFFHILSLIKCTIFVNKVIKDGARPAQFQNFVLFYVLFACKCVLYYCHRVTTQL
jgi:hypothetical protein